ncbi:L-type lectin-domain containing receptor kinase IV.2-like [Dioscorea cayenensis subsp. rotundata]|uniref:non-specific serine/threonine protein kinase n=1 Tax=Dioscorea cayennensis subsp. rotundata TaxID=55577 RepID=A0AB40CY09_DIOCR|nr:L-type lectin-domain containing receptor kinase IV.2-like [Dioscorea cayenensis subsp. rotundata]
MAAILLLSLTLILITTKVIAQNTSTNFIYNGFAGVSNLTMEAAAAVTTSGVLQLTNTSTNVIGRAFFPSSIPSLLPGNKTISFSTTFVFQILKSTTSSGGGHGLAFTFSPTKITPSPGCCPYLGLFGRENNGNSSNHIFAVEFDTARGFRFFTSESHVGININNIVSVSSASPSYYDNTTNSDVNLDFLQGDPLHAWIEYDGVLKVLNVTLASLNVAKPSKPLISYATNLSDVFKENMYVGFSASTGTQPNSHYISGWSFRVNGEAQALDLSSLPFPPQPSTRGSSSSKLSNAATIGITFSITIIVVATVIAVILYLRLRARLAETIEDWELYYPHRFPYKELYKATKGFKEGELLGKGGFGHVYKVVLRGTGEEVAVKRISNSSQQGVREFIAEISSLGRLRHRHLVHLQGWCKRNEDLLLVYEFMPNRSLDLYLFESHKNNMTLTWDQRYKILKGIALGLLYLHEEWEQVVVHRDIKASNVLLDSEMNGRFGDFGLARLYEHGDHPHTTHVVGTVGYMAPEISRTGKATASSDVFSFGALLLEVACGRRPIEMSYPPREMILLDWVKECYLKGKTHEVVDGKLGDEFNQEEMEMVVKLGIVCCSSRPETRPSMRQVTKYLNGDEVLSDGWVVQLCESDSSMDLGSHHGSSNPSSTDPSTNFSTYPHGVVSSGSFLGGR